MLCLWERFFLSKEAKGECWQECLTFNVELVPIASEEFVSHGRDLGCGGGGK